ncbi:peptidase S10 [Candidatus Villigracilis affinis]|uniref:S10 family peptidase n=1 Tax=Candidatus Villigracilis affinis TaxID=3140682 RepID=UPI001E156DF2|nr:peptidase S10 [Anaerolineales bacterium]
MAEKKPEEKKDEKKEEKPSPKDNLVETKHSVKIGGKTIKYTVTTGTMVVKEEVWDKEKDAEVDKPRAQMFFVAYTLDGVKDRAKRPITFSFNGGPGSSSVWLHMGVLGPRRVVLTDEGEMPPPPFKLIDNAFSILDETDLVFIDPMSTGYSRPVEGEKSREWHTFSRDIASVGDFIRLYSTRYHRWLSPKFLAGESYGTTRASGLSGYLQERHGMFLNGLILISAVLDFTTIDFNLNNDLPYILFLPAYAATAWYHGKLSFKAPLKEVVREAEEFAKGEYATALLKGAALTPEERASVVEKLSRYTGISKDFIERTNLRIYDQHFFKELLRERGKTVGRLDSRFTGIDRNGVTAMPDYDPLFAQVNGPYTATLNDYLRAELKFETDLPYEILSDKVFLNWSYEYFQNQYVNVAETLRASMTFNKYLKVFVANGYYDLGTPYFATEYTFDHLGLDESLRKNISMGYYEAGHMMYIHIPSLKQLKKDIAKFIKDAS